MILMRLEEERVGDVFMMILCVCLLQGGSECMDSVDCMLMFEYVDLGVLGKRLSSSRYAIRLFTDLEPVWVWIFIDCCGVTMLWINMNCMDVVNSCGIDR